jgi:2-C-methyl-D-erythritol 2,4-cyclodiphosphate synthase
MRVGQGIDVHAFSDDATRPLILGGVVVPDSPGLAGHSDADVVTHALIDAMLGAAGLGDLGRHFPSSDPSLEGVSSLVMFEQVLVKLSDAQWVLTSGDVSIVAQTPRLERHLDAMSAVLSEKAHCVISVKATTTDHLGFIGQGQGIAAMAVVLLEER